MTYNQFITMLENTCNETRTSEPKVQSDIVEEPLLLSQYKAYLQREGLLDDIVEGDTITIHFPYGIKGY